MNLDFNTLTVGEGRELEKVTGQNLGNIIKQFDAGDYSVDLLSAFLLVMGRRENPDLTIEDVDKLAFSSLQPDPQ